MKRFFCREITGFVVLIVLLISFSAHGTTAPDFSLTTIEGKQIRLSEMLKKGPVVLDFWATSCKPCLEEFPCFQKVYNQYRQFGVTVLCISIDNPRSQSKVLPLIKSKNYTFEVAIDSGYRVAKQFNVVVIPRTLVIGMDGEIVFGCVGYSPSNCERIEHALKSLIESKEKKADEK
ncbi:MAG: peroxiredoxin family protein [bacterium]